AGHGFWLPLLPPTHIAGVQVLARAHRTAQVLGLDRPALPEPLPERRGHFDAAAFVALAEPALAQAAQAGLPAFTSLVPTQLTRIVTGATGADARARALLRRFAAVLVGGAATGPDVLARARGQRIAVRTTYGSSETAGGCVYDRHPLPGVELGLEAPDASGAGRLRITSPTLALGYVTADGSADTSPFTDGPRRSVLARARGQRIAVRTTYGSSETAGGCVYDRHPLPGVELGLEAPDASGAGRLRITSPTLALGYVTADGSADTSPFTDGPRRSVLT